MPLIALLVEPSDLIAPFRNAYSIYFLQVRERTKLSSPMRQSLSATTPDSSVSEGDGSFHLHSGRKFSAPPKTASGGKILNNKMITFTLIWLLWSRFYRWKPFWKSTSKPQHRL